jgi:putative copper export protein
MGAILSVILQGPAHAALSQDQTSGLLMVAVGVISLIVSIGLLAGTYKGASRSGPQGIALSRKLRRFAWILIIACGFLIAFGIILVLL